MRFWGRGVRKPNSLLQHGAVSEGCPLGMTCENTSTRSRLLFGRSRTLNETFVHFKRPEGHSDVVAVLLQVVHLIHIVRNCNYKRATIEIVQYNGRSSMVLHRSAEF